MKTCSKCGTAKPLIEYYPRYAQCRACLLKMQAQYRAENAEEIKERKRQQYRARHPQIRRRGRDPEKARACAVRYRAAHPNRVAASQTAWQERNPGLAAERASQWYAANPERHEASRLAWQQANKERVKASQRLSGAARRARQAMLATHPFTREQLRAKLAYWNDQCWVCGDRATAIDHVKPVRRGGAHMLCNFRPICKPCNSRKRDKWPLPSRAKILGFVAAD